MNMQLVNDLPAGVTEPGRDYYVTLRRQVVDRVRTGFLAGPFKTHDEALAMVRRAWDEAEQVDPRAFWDVCGTSSLPHDERNPRGVLNDRLGI